MIVAILKFILWQTGSQCNSERTGVMWQKRDFSVTSLIISTLYSNLVIFISETSVEFVIFFLFLQPLLLQIHLFPANLTIAIHFTLASHKQISKNFNAFKIDWHVSLQILQNINTSHQHSKTTLASYQKENRVQNLSSHIQNPYISTTHISLQ